MNTVNENYNISIIKLSSVAILRGIEFSINDLVKVLGSRIRYRSKYSRHNLDKIMYRYSERVIRIKVVYSLYTTYLFGELCD